MLDFLMISQRHTRTGVEIVPSFKATKVKDLMVRGGDFYAIWDEEQNKWSTDPSDAVRLIDNELVKYTNEHQIDNCRTLYMWDCDSRSIDKWNRFVKNQMWDSYTQLDDTIVFAGQDTNRETYSTFCLPYKLSPAATPAYDELMSTLYSSEERHKIEWAIGAVVSGDARWIQKFIVFVGDGGTGKSTVLKIIRKLFQRDAKQGYCAVIDAKAVGSTNASFSLESLRNNPLVVIQDDTDLSHIEDNTKLNSLVSHEPVLMNIKNKSQYETAFHFMMFLGSNSPVRITDSKSGIIRRLIDVEPTGNLVPFDRYLTLMDQIDFELGGIAAHCLEVYKKNKTFYNKYIPTNMMRSTNVIYSFLEEKMQQFNYYNPGVTLSAAWTAFQDYCNTSDIVNHPNKMKFKAELKGYFKNFDPETRLADGTHVWNWYSNLRWDKFHTAPPEPEPEPEDILEELDTWILLKKQHSLLDDALADCPAQYAGSHEGPRKEWAEVKTTLKDLNTSRLHFCKVPDISWIFVDFDIRDADGNKDLEANIKAASAFPPTYVETSKSGGGLHLHYIYDGDANDLSAIYAPGIEIKVQKGGSSLRRKLVKCNDMPIATISSGLPLKPKEAKTMFNSAEEWNEKSLRTFIQRCINKEYPPHTTVCNIDYIDKKLNELYDSGVPYDVSDLYTAIYTFGANSTNNALDCVKKVEKMKLISKTETPSETYEAVEGDIVFFDVEVFPNLFVVVWKPIGKDCISWINPTPQQVESLRRYKLIGYNNRNYDNHIIFARALNYSNEQLYHLSKALISGQTEAKFRPAFNWSYTDIYDYASAMHKKSLKKYEIELAMSGQAIIHKELGLSWDEPVPEDKWAQVVEYCVNDVITTEAVHKYLSGDWTARQILADLAGGSVNDTTNQLTTKIIFEGKPKMQTDPALVYTDLSEMFPGYTFENGVSMYRGEEVGEGGYVYAEPGMYEHVALLDIASMHPTSIENLNLFGDYTKNYSDLKKGRILIKHADWDGLSNLLGGKLKPYVDRALENDDMGIMKDLSNALKTALNSAYGLTSAKFDNQLRHKDNVDNIVAKRGSLFMVNLKHEVQARGFTVAHIKTDSIKIPNATPEIIQFVMDYGRKYGYTFEHEATYEKMCLVNDAVYIAKYEDGEHEFKLSTGEKINTPWTATGTQFQVPYVFKALFAKKPVVFNDFIEIKSVKSALYLDMNESLPDVSAEEKESVKLNRSLTKAINEGNNELAISLQNDIIKLKEQIALGHKYEFVGRVGAFVPILPGFGGGWLMRQQDDKFASATGAKGYRWLEASDVKDVREDQIDVGYFNNLADEAIANISQYGDIEWFVA